MKEGNRSCLLQTVLCGERNRDVQHISHGDGALVPGREKSLNTDLIPTDASLDDLNANAFVRI